MDDEALSVAELDRLDPAAAAQWLSRCCGARRFVEALVEARPLGDLAGLLERAERELDRLGPEDWLESFAQHPRIGDLEALRRRYDASGRLAGSEQARAAGAAPAILEALAEGNRLYEERFGHIFIVCATGKSAGEMLELLHQRLENDPQQELAVAAGEQRKITRLRLEKLFR